VEKSEQTLFEEKACLIYEYDNRSPLFVRRAKMEIDSHNLDAAVEILTIGIHRFPDYATAYFLLGKALALQGKYPEALKIYKQGSALIDSDATYEYYEKEVDDLKRMRSPFNIKKRTTFVENSFPALESEALGQYASTKQPEDDNSLSELAERLSNAKMRLPNSETEPEFKPRTTYESEGGIVSETLAKIYASQGKIQEAIKIYEILMKRNPERTNEIVSIIQQLYVKLREQQ
jgi:tetratricopeptide (TPR) repeat protein